VNANKPSIDKLLELIESKEEELILLTQALVQIPTVNPPGDYYGDCIELLRKRLEASKFEINIIRAEGTPGDTEQYPRLNIIARREGSRPGPCVHFNSHIDVVPPGNGWDDDPFSAAVKDGKIFGRGTCDMKGGLAASIIAVEALLEWKPDFAGAIEISGTADEETGGYGGVAYLAEKGWMAVPRIDHVIIPEPLNKDRICLGHRGVWWSELETFGTVAHGSMPFLGDSAIRHMAAVLEEFEQKLLPSLQQKVTAMPVVPDGAKQSTINFNSIHGGLGEGFAGLPAPMVADSCRLVLDRRFLIEEELSEVKLEVKSILEELTESRANFSYQLKDLFEVVPSMTDQNAAVVQSVSHGINRVFGREPEYVVSPGTYDQKHIDRIGKLNDCIAYGPGILDLAHQANEYVGITDMVESAKVMAIATYELLSGEPSQ
jgi:succinyl-diaminopimelate desuccinylase